MIKPTVVSNLAHQDKYMIPSQRIAHQPVYLFKKCPIPIPVLVVWQSVGIFSITIFFLEIVIIAPSDTRVMVITIVYPPKHVPPVKKSLIIMGIVLNVQKDNM
jgi:hypothetical protein